MGQDLNILFLFVGKSYQSRDTNRKPFVDGIFFFKTSAKLRLNQLAFVDTMFLSNESGAGPYLDRVTSYASVVYNKNPDFVFTSFLMGTAFVGYVTEWGVTVVSQLSSPIASSMEWLQGGHHV